MTFDEKVRCDWLAAFVEYAGFGEASPRLMYWVGVSTLAAVLGRKVWFDQEDFQWSPNFYILIVGEQGAVRKSTSIDIGMRLLKQIESVKRGPGSATWAAFIELASQSYREVTLPGGDIFGSTDITLPLSEFGTFFKPQDNDMVDGLTDMWDGKLDSFEKRTRKHGLEEVKNPWINLIAATTPKWVARNLTDDLIGSGLISRFIFLHGEMPVKDISYPKRCMPADRPAMRTALIARLRELATFAGGVDLTEPAYEWGDAWYRKQRDFLRAQGFGTLEAGFLTRKQVHLHKLAIIVAASRGHLPTIELEDLLEAEQQLSALDDDTRRVFGVVGQTKVTSASRELVDAVRRAGPRGVVRSTLYRTHFMRTMEAAEFAAAVSGAVAADLLIEAGPANRPVLVAKEFMQ